MFIHLRAEACRIYIKSVFDKFSNTVIEDKIKHNNIPKTIPETYISQF